MWKLPRQVLIFTLLHYISLSLSSVDGETTEFDLQKMSLTSLKLLGDAHLNNGSIRLTRDLPVPNSGSGRALYKKAVRFKGEGGVMLSFSTSFSFSVINLNPSSVGGGLTFLISPDDETVGEAGGFLGLNGLNGVNGLKGLGAGFVGVEFDTLMDVEFNDMNGNHVGLDLNSLVSEQACDLEEVGVELKSGNLVNAWIDYDGWNAMLNVSVSYSNLRPKQPLLLVQLDLNQFVQDYMFVGFSGSTQGSTEIHSVQAWSFSSSLFTPPGSSPPPPPLESSPPPASPPTTLFFAPNRPTDSILPASPPPSPAPSDAISSKMSKPSSCHNQICKGNPGAVAGVVSAGAFVLAIFACLLIWLFTKRFKLIKKTESLAPEIIRTPKEFSYKELKLATRGFDSERIIGHGAFGTVYKGILSDTGALVAVKRCSHNDGQGKAEFLSELSIIGTLRHRNLVRLQGWCHEKGEILLVYDFMPNGSLDKVLFESRMPLQWHHRRKILLGVASALAYLHQECENQVIHRDVKTSNIMLDEEYNARLGDFGLARQIEHDKSPEATVAAGTMGYLAPEYLLTGRATEKTDVFSFGAVVLEVASGRRPIEREGSGVGRVGLCSNLVDWVWRLHREGKLVEAADPRLEGEFDEGEMRRLLMVGLICSHPDHLVRPRTRSVVQMLVGEAEVPVVPRSKPSMSFSTSHLLMSLQDSVEDCTGLITLSSDSSERSFDGGEIV